MISYTFGYTLEEEVWKKIIKQKKRKKLERFSSFFFSESLWESAFLQFFLFYFSLIFHS